MMDEEDFAFWRELIDAGNNKLAYEYAIKSSELAQENLKFITEADYSAEEFIQFLGELVVSAKEGAEKNNAQLSSGMVDKMVELLEYMRVVVDRSEAMAAAMLDLLEDHPGDPLAMTTGNMHGDHMVEIFAEAGVSVVWIHPLALSEGNKAGLMTDEAYARYEQDLSPSPDGTLGALFDNRRKPPGRGEKEVTTLEYLVRSSLQNLAMEIGNALFSSLPANDEEMKEFIDEQNKLLNDELDLTGFRIDQKIEFLSMKIKHPENYSLDQFEVDFILRVTEGDVIKDRSGTLRFKPGGLERKEEITIDERLDNAKKEVSKPPETETTDRTIEAGVTKDVCGNTQVTWKTEG